MSKLLIFDQGRLTTSQRGILHQEFSGQHILYCDQKATWEEMVDADIILGLPDPGQIKECRNLKLLQLFSAGADQYLGKLPQGARLANATGAYGLAISEHLLAMLLLLMKKLHLYCRNQLTEQWQDEGQVASVYGSTALIVGLGDIGGEFASRLHALGAYTIGIRRNTATKPDYVDELHAFEQLDALLPQADIVALCLPGTPQTAGLMSKERLALMKPGSILLNVGRGSAVDQDALAEALQSGHLGGAGVDVTQPEPLPAGHPLWSAPNMLITPHIAGGDHLPETYNRIIQIAVGNIHAALSGGAVRNEIDPITGERV